MPLEIKVLRTLEEIEALRPFWTGLDSDPESDLDFIQFIIRSRPEILSPYVLAALEGGKPVALLAGRIEKGSLDVKLGYKVLGRIRIRRLSIFYGGMLGRTKGPTARALVQRLLKSLREENADMLMWSGVRKGSELDTLLRRDPGFLSRDRLSKPVLRWHMSLPESLDELLEKRMNKKHRYWAKRTMRILEKDFPDGVRFACYAKPEEMEKFFNDAIAVAKTTYQWALGVGFRDNQEQKDRLMLEAKKGWLRGYVLYLKNEPAAFWISLVCKDTAYSAYTGYNPVYQKYEIGTSLFLRMLGEMCRDRVKSLDFGPGTALYKERFGDSHFQETTLCIFSSSARGAMLNLARTFTEGPMEITRSVVKRLGLEQKIKKAWRSRAAASQPAKAGAATQQSELNTVEG